MERMDTIGNHRGKTSSELRKMAPDRKNRNLGYKKIKTNLKIRSSYRGKKKKQKKKRNQRHLF